MSLVEKPVVSHLPESINVEKSSSWRLPTLGLLLLLSFSINLLHVVWKPLPEDARIPVLPVWALSFLPYLAACFIVLCTRRQSGRRFWIEQGMIIGGAFLLRAMLLSITPNMSSDAWRYLWDARVTLHGFSPYVYYPDHPSLVPFHDPLVYGHMVYHDVPTIYPPGAQAIYLVSYLLAPDNLPFLKGIFMLFDLVSCCVLALLLYKRGLDPSRTIIYAWCPLPIVEFAIQGHVDALVVCYLLLTVLCSLSNWRGARVLTGFLLAMATLAKLYPIILLVVFVRRRDYALLATFIVTVVLGYVPYLLLGHGQIFGFFDVYTNQHGANGGVVQIALIWIQQTLHLDLRVVVPVERAIDLALVTLLPLLVLFWRWRNRISREASILLLVGVVFSISSHVFPWYITVFIPWIAVLIGPLWTKTERGLSRFQSRNIAVASLWYFICTAILGYVTAVPNDWRPYYLIVYDVLCLGLVLAIVVAVLQMRARTKASISPPLL